MRRSMAANIADYIADGDGDGDGDRDGVFLCDSAAFRKASRNRMIWIQVNYVQIGRSALARVGMASFSYLECRALFCLSTICISSQWQPGLSAGGSKQRQKKTASGGCLRPQRIRFGAAAYVSNALAASQRQPEE